MESFNVNVGDKSFIVSYNPVEGLNLSDLMEIHHENIMGEILLSPTHLGMISIIKAELENQVTIAKLQKDIAWGEGLKSTFDRLKEENPKYTADIIEGAAKGEEGYVNAYTNLADLERQLSIVNGAFWAMKDKAAKIEMVANKIGDEAVEASMKEVNRNGVSISKVKM